MLSDGARHNFSKRGVVVVQGQNVSTERALELAIEAGAEDVQETEDEDEQPLLQVRHEESRTALMTMKIISGRFDWQLFLCPQFFCDMMDVRKVQASLAELGMQITSAGVEFVPRTLLSLDQDQLDAASALIEALNDYPDVIRVWDNIQADSWARLLDTWWTLNILRVENLI